MHRAAPCRWVPVTFTLDGTGAMLLLLPFACILLGGLIGYFLPRRQEGEEMASRRGAVYFGLGLLAFAAVVANSPQTLYEIGLTFGAIDVVAGLALFAGSTALVGVWCTLYPRRSRWLLLVPGGILLLQPLLTTLTLAIWGLNGFAP